MNVQKSANTGIPTILAPFPKIYSFLEAQEISDKIAELIMPEDMKAKLKIMYQSITSLHKSCPNHSSWILCNFCHEWHV